MASRTFRDLVEARYGDKLSERDKTLLTQIGTKSFNEDGSSDWTELQLERRRRERRAELAQRRANNPELLARMAAGRSRSGGSSRSWDNPYEEGSETARLYDQLMESQQTTQTVDPRVEGSSGAGPMGILTWAGRGLDYLRKQSFGAQAEIADARQGLQDRANDISPWLGGALDGVLEAADTMSPNIAGLIQAAGGTASDDGGASLEGFLARTRHDDGWGEGFGNTRALEFDEDDGVGMKTVKGLGAFVGDVVSDPLTWGGVGLVSQPGRKAGTEMAEQAARQVAKRPENGLDVARLGADEAAKLAESGMGRRRLLGRVAEAVSDAPAARGGEKILTQEVEDLLRQGYTMGGVLSGLREVAPQAYRQIVEDGVAGVARNAYFQRGSTGLREALGEIAETFGEGAAKQDELFAQFPKQVQGGVQLRGFGAGTGMNPVGTAPRAVGGGKVLPAKLLDAGHATRNFLRSRAPARAAAKHLGGKYGALYARSLDRLASEDWAETLDTWRAVRDIDRAVDANVALMFDEESVLRAGEVAHMLEGSAVDNSEGMKALKAHFLHRGDSERIGQEVAALGLSDDAAELGAALSQVLYRDIDRAYGQLAEAYGPERALNFINDYVPRVLSERTEDVAQSAWSPMASRSGAYMSVKVDEGTGQINNVYWSPTDANSAAGEDLFKTDPMEITGDYLAKLKHLVREQMLWDEWRKAGIIQQTKDVYEFAENVRPAGAQNSQVWRSRALQKIEDVRRGRAGDDPVLDVPEVEDILLSRRGDGELVDRSRRWLDVTQAVKVGLSSQGTNVWERDGVRWWKGRNGKVYVEPADDVLFQRAGSRLRALEVEDGREVATREELLALADREIVTPDYEAAHRELAERLEGGGLVSPLDEANGISARSRKPAALRGRLTRWLKRGGELLDGELPETYSQRSTRDGWGELEDAVELKGSDGRALGGFATRAVDGEKEVIVPFGVESRPVMEAMVRSGATLAEVPVSMVERFRVFGWAPREVPGEVDGAVSMRLDPQQALGRRSIEDARLREAAWEAGESSPVPARQAAPAEAGVEQAVADTLDAIDYVFEGGLTPAEWRAVQGEILDDARETLNRVAPGEVDTIMDPSAGARAQLRAVRDRLRQDSDDTFTTGVVDGTEQATLGPQQATRALDEFATTDVPVVTDALTGRSVRTRPQLVDEGPKPFDSVDEAEQALADMFPDRVAARETVERSRQLDEIAAQMVEDEELLARAFDFDVMREMDEVQQDEHMKAVVSAISRQLDLNERATGQVRKQVFGKRVKESYADDVSELTGGDWTRAWDNPDLQGALAKRFEQTGAVGPKALLDDIAAMQKALRASDATFNKFWEPLYNFWKATVTAGSLRSIGFMTRNAAGGMTNAWIKGVTPAHFGRAAQLMRAVSKAEKQAIDELGYGVTYAALRARRNSIMQETMDTDLVNAFRAFEANNLGSASRVSDLNTSRAGQTTSRTGMRSDVQSVGGDLERQLLDFAGGRTFSGKSRTELRRQLRGEDGGGLGSRAVAAAQSYMQWRVDAKLFRKLGQANNSVEQYLRLGSFLKGVDDWGLKDGGVAASQIVRQTQFDYGDLSATERRLRSGIVGMPFYSWVRNNVPLQARMAVSDPGRLNVLLRGQETVQNIFGSDPDDRVGRDAENGEIIPEWVRDSMGFNTDLANAVEGTPFEDWAQGTVTLRTDLPLHDLNRWVEKNPDRDGLAGLQLDYQEAISGLNPFLKGGVEAAMGVSTFTKAPLPETEAAWWAKGLDALPFVETTRVVDGVEYTNPYLANWVNNTLPDVGMIDRYGGATGRYKERQLSSILSGFGLPVATSTDRQVRAEMFQRMRELEDQAERHAGPFQTATLGQIRDRLDRGRTPGDTRAEMERRGLLGPTP